MHMHSIIFVFKYRHYMYALCTLCTYVHIMYSKHTHAHTPTYLIFNLSPFSSTSGRTKHDVVSTNECHSMLYTIVILVNFHANTLKNSVTRVNRVRWLHRWHRHSFSIDKFGNASTQTAAIYMEIIPVWIITHTCTHPERSEWNRRSNPVGCDLLNTQYTKIIVKIFDIISIYSVITYQLHLTTVYKSSLMYSMAFWWHIKIQLSLEQRNDERNYTGLSFH